MKVTSPVGAIKVTEIGWWVDTTSQEADFDVGIYTHNVGDGEPEAVVGVLSQNNAKGTTGGVWKKATGLDIPITAETIYWIAMQLDSGEATNTDGDSVGGSGRAYKTSQTELESPWGSSTGLLDRRMAFYAVWEAAAVGVTRKIKIGGTFQDKPIKTKVAGTFEDKPISIKVGGTFQDA